MNNIDISTFFYRISNNIQLTRGYNRSIILSFSNNSYEFIPNELYEILLKFNGKKRIIDIINEKGNNDKETLLEYFDFLKNNRFIIITDNDEKFNNLIPLKTGFNLPYKISNCVVEINSSPVNNLLVDRLLESNLSSLSIFINMELSEIQAIYDFLRFFNNSNIIYIELHLKYFSNLTEVVISQLFKIQYRLLKVLVYESPKDELTFEKTYKENLVLWTKTKMHIENCGIVNPFYYAINKQFYFESLNHNTCLNRKVCIDVKGEIKNCPSISKSYGNIKNTTLAEAIEKHGFKDLWFINKDKIDVCKVCEFRHICTDCRAFIKDPENIYSQPAKCPYNPYIAKWEGNKGYVPVEECGTYTKETGFVVNKRKVNKLNKQI